MKYEIKEVGETVKKIEVELTVEDFSRYYNEALKEFAEEVELPGFRKGKAPEKMVEEKVNPSDLLSEAAEHAIRDNWLKILAETNMEAVSQPHVEIVKIAKGNPFVFSAEVEVLPVIKLPDCKEISKEIKKEEVKVDDKEVDDTLSWLQQSRAKLSPKDGPAEKGDMVEITFSSPDIKEDKEKKDRFVIGKGHYVKGMEEALTGIKAEEVKEFETNNPLNEKERIRIIVKADSVQKVETPEATDDWAKTMGNFKDLAALREDIKKGIKEEKEFSLKQQRREDVLKKILEKTKFSVPQSMANRELEELMENLKHRVSEELHITFEEYLDQIKKKEEEVREDFKKVAEDRVRGFLILHQIAKDEKIETKEDEIEKKLEELLSHYPDKESVKRNMDVEKVKMYIEDEIQREKIFNLLGC